MNEEQLIDYLEKKEIENQKELELFNMKSDIELLKVEIEFLKSQLNQAFEN